MKRLHVHVAVPDLHEAITFYSAVFGAAPTRTKKDYAKWQLEDPRVNFAISARPDTPGLRHLGVQVDERRELTALRTRMGEARASAFDEGETVCCYARSDKSWVHDPAGLSWELFHTFEEVDDDEDAPAAKELAPATACCRPEETRARATPCCEH